jgi:DNA-binding transcriptional LysR family regulator
MLCAPTLGVRSKVPTVEMLARDPLAILRARCCTGPLRAHMTLCTQLGLDPPVRHEVRHWLSVVALVSRRTGYALVPKAMCD